MISADQFHQAETRVRQVKDPLLLFGGLGMNLCGDFLQLPPVMAGELKITLASNEEDFMRETSKAEPEDEKEKEKSRGLKAESLQGLQA